MSDDHDGLCKLDARRAISHQLGVLTTTGRSRCDSVLASVRYSRPCQPIGGAGSIPPQRGGREGGWIRAHRSPTWVARTQVLRKVQMVSYVQRLRLHGSTTSWA